MSVELCVNTSLGLGLSTEKMIPALAAAGFDGVFTGWAPGDPIKEWAKLIRECGMKYQSVHSPFKKVDKLWEEGAAGDDAVDELIRCVHECTDAEVPIVIVHPIIGMDKHTPTETGIRRFSRLVRAGEETGVKIAFENVEGIEYLEKIIAELGDSDAVGYCWDTGHEMCYNHCADVPAMFGDKLICTHLNDNMKQTDPAVVTWLDDSHLMAGDGLADWQGIVRRLLRCGYSGELTFELTAKGKPGRDTHRIYDGLSPEAFIALAYEKSDAVRKAFSAARDAD